MLRLPCSRGGRWASGAASEECLVGGLANQEGDLSFGAHKGTARIIGSGAGRDALGAARRCAECSGWALQGIDVSYDCRLEEGFNSPERGLT